MINTTDFRTDFSLDPPIDDLVDERFMERWANNDPALKQDLDKLLYYQLRRLATTYMRRQPRNHTLQATALVNEAMTRVIGSTGGRLSNYEDKRHFYATVAKVMRNVLVSHARMRQALKRNQAVDPTLLASAPPDAGNVEIAGDAVGTDGGIDLVEWDNALARLHDISKPAAEAMELHYFAGLTRIETAHVMHLAPRTLDRHIRFGKAWLLNELKGAPKTPPKTS